MAEKGSTSAGQARTSFSRWSHVGYGLGLGSGLGLARKTTFLEVMCAPRFLDRVIMGKGIARRKFLTTGHEARAGLPGRNEWVRLKLFCSTP